MNEWMNEYLSCGEENCAHLETSSGEAGLPGVDTSSQLSFPHSWYTFSKTVLVILCGFPLGKWLSNHLNNSSFIFELKPIKWSRSEHILVRFPQNLPSRVRSLSRTQLCWAGGLRGWGGAEAGRGYCSMLSRPQCWSGCSEMGPSSSIWASTQQTNKHDRLLYESLFHHVCLWLPEANWSVEITKGLSPTSWAARLQADWTGYCKNHTDSLHHWLGRLFQIQSHSFYVFRVYRDKELENAAVTGMTGLPCR